jgi:ribosome-associated protein
MLRINDQLSIGEHEFEESFVRSSGPGGQNVNKLSTAVQLRFYLFHSSLPAEVKHRLAKLAGRRLTKEGEILIIADQHRTQERNRADARKRLVELIRQAAVRPIPRRKTRVPHSSKRKRLEGKRHRSDVKKMRQGPGHD